MVQRTSLAQSYDGRARGDAVGTLRTQRAVRETEGGGVCAGRTRITCSFAAGRGASKRARTTDGVVARRRPLNRAVCARAARLARGQTCDIGIRARGTWIAQLRCFRVGIRASGAFDARRNARAALLSAVRAGWTTITDRHASLARISSRFTVATRYGCVERVLTDRTLQTIFDRRTRFDDGICSRDAIDTSCGGCCV